MKIRILHIGKTSSNGLSGFIDEFVKRCSRFAQVECLAVPGIKGKQTNSAEIKRQEAGKLLERVSNTDHLILLDEGGKTMSSRSFAKLLSDRAMQSGARLVFVIGGAAGFDESIVARASRKISLSQMTFNHELALAVFAEQLYRGLTIMHGHPYHND